VALSVGLPRRLKLKDDPVRVEKIDAFRWDYNENTHRAFDGLSLGNTLTE